MRRSVLLLTALGAAALALATQGAPRDGGPARAGEPTQGGPQLVASATADGAGGRPRDGRGAPEDDIVEAIESRLASRRVEALRRVAAEGGDAAALGPRIEALVADPDPRTALWAKGALLGLGGPPSLRVEVTRAVLENPGWSDAEDLLRAVSRDTADAVLAAGKEQRARGGRGVVLEGLDEALSRWGASGRPDAVDVTRPLAWTTGEDLSAWLRIVRGLRPVPAPALRALAGRLPAAPPEDAGAIAKFFASGPDLASADDQVERALLAQAMASAPGRAAAWLLALAGLPALSAESREGIERVRARSPEDAQDVAVALRARG